MQTREVNISFGNLPAYPAKAHMPRGIYLVNSKTREKIAVNGCRRSDKQLDCQPFCNYVKYTEDELPRIADLRPYMSQIENQRKTLTW